MSKVFLFAFVAIGGIAAIGVDYLNQSRRAGLALGQMPAADYLASVTGRFVDQKATIAAAAERTALLQGELRAHLPEAPQGWTRRDWAQADRARLYKIQPGEKSESGTSMPMFGSDATLKDQLRQAQLWVYEKDSAIVSVRLAHNAPAGAAGSITGMTQNMLTAIHADINGKGSTDGFVVVQGVTYVQTTGVFGDDITDNPFRVFDARIGDEVTIDVRANAPDEAILEVLNAIDYDRLNSLLSVPVTGIGSSAPKLSPEKAVAQADINAVERSTAEQEQAALAKLKVEAASLELMRQSGRISQADYDRVKAAMDAKLGNAQAVEAAAPAGDATPRIEATCEIQGSTKFCSVGKI